MITCSVSLILCNTLSGLWGCADLHNLPAFFHQVLCERDSRIRLGAASPAGALARTESFGLLEIFYDGEWGTVCQ